jgi:hypothetical protein
MSEEQNIDKVIEQMLISPIEEVVDIANKAAQFNEMFIAGEISGQEFNDLLSDLTKLDNINQQMIEVERWNEICAAAEILNMARQWIPLL